MEFGIFDHLDRSGAPLGAFYADRLALAEAYDQLGFRSYHIAEHHATPLGMAPSPGVYLAALAQRTRRLRFGPLVYSLPFYHPVRLIEEICMLDQMSRGRLELGVGRGISPIETAYYGLDPAKSPAAYEAALELVLKGLAGKSLAYAGQDVPMELEPLQKPHPPIWLGAHSSGTAAWAGARGYNFVSLDTAATVRGLVERYRAAAAEAGARPGLTGLARFVVVAEDAAEAMAIGRRAHPVWFASFNHLYRKHGRGPVLGERPKDFDAIVEHRSGVAGTPDQVLSFLKAEAAEAQVNYLVAQFAFGDMTLAEARRSAELFARHVMPALAA